MEEPFFPTRKRRARALLRNFARKRQRQQRGADHAEETSRTNATVVPSKKKSSPKAVETPKNEKTEVSNDSTKRKVPKAINIDRPLSPNSSLDCTGVDDSPQVANNEEWTCEKCTCKNPINHRRCSACTSRRPPLNTGDATDRAPSRRKQQSPVGGKKTTTTTASPKKPLKDVENANTFVEHVDFVDAEHVNKETKHQNAASSQAARNSSRQKSVAAVSPHENLPANQQPVADDSNAAASSDKEESNTQYPSNSVGQESVAAVSSPGNQASISDKEANSQQSHNPSNMEVCVEICEKVNHNPSEEPLEDCTSKETKLEKILALMYQLQRDNRELNRKLNQMTAKIIRIEHKVISGSTEGSFPQPERRPRASSLVANGNGGAINRETGPPVTNFRLSSPAGGNLVTTDRHRTTSAHAVEEKATLNPTGAHRKSAAHDSSPCSSTLTAPHTNKKVGRSRRVTRSPAPESAVGVAKRDPSVQPHKKASEKQKQKQSPKKTQASDQGSCPTTTKDTSLAEPVNQPEIEPPMSLTQDFPAESAHSTQTVVPTMASNVASKSQRKTARPTSRPSVIPQLEFVSVAEGRHQQPGRDTTGSPSKKPLKNSTNANQAASNDGWISNKNSRQFLREMDTGAKEVPIREDNTKWMDSRPPKPVRGTANDSLWDESQPGYAYKETVRCKAVREGLPCHECESCKRFYQTLVATGHEFSQDPINYSRHRHRFQPPTTPPDFWELDFPDERDRPAK